jgi:eukaryotic-like serine/threonine-protein kinase
VSYCFNPNCQRPENPDSEIVCASCGSDLLLKNRYRAIRFLDSGGMSRNFVGVDTATPGMPCYAIKQFFPAPQVLDDPEAYAKAVELFQREGEQLGRLGEDSPHIPQLYATVEQQKRFYLVQEFIDGENLCDELDRDGAFNEHKVRQLLEDLIPVVEFIHDRNIIHRDIKPENIMRRRTGELVLIDFGMSKNLNSTIVSSKGTTGGTVGYAPPEQVRGGAAYPASDIYALGATCVHLLTDITPDRLYDFQKNKWTWRTQLEAQGGKVSNQLAEVLDIMLKPELADRYPSIESVELALGARHAPSVLWARKLTIAAAAVAGILGTLGSVWLLREPIECYMGKHNDRYCPEPLVIQKPQKLGDVVYYPYLRVGDSQGRIAKFNMAIISDSFEWDSSSDSQVMPKGEIDPEKITKVEDLAKQIQQKGDLAKVMENPNQILAIGTASCEGTTKNEEDRAKLRAIAIKDKIVKPLFRVEAYRTLNLGQFKKDNCLNTPQGTAFQRSLIIVGMQRESEGVEVKEALYKRLSRTIANLKLDDYSLGTQQKFNVSMPEGRGK